MACLKILLLLFCAVLSQALIEEKSFFSVNWNNVKDNKLVSRRLPNNSLPIRYDLWVKTDIDKKIFEFEGRVKIQVKIVEDSENITLNLFRSTIIEINLFDNKQENIASNLTFDYESDLEFLLISLPRIFYKNDEITLDIKYKGKLREDLGFYRSSYENEKGDRIYYATTHFEMTEARHVMPCYDEPQIRAVISIQIQHDKSYNAISNMPIVSREVINGTDYVTSKFQDTLPMQTYLIAFVISDFTFISNNDSRVEQRIYANPLAIARGEGDFALSIVGPILRKFEEYFGIEYPLPKIDHGAITDFRYWAMENYGLFLYREQFLLHNSLEGEENKEEIIKISAHEFAHQYFGNLVAPKWWTYAWLNEGFATLYQYMMPDMLYPGQGYMDQFKSEVIDKAMYEDTYTSQPMTRYAEEVDSILENFNSIGNHKAAAVLFMFQEAFTRETFTKGLKYYLNAMKFSAATPDDLHRELQRALDEDFPGNGVNVDEVMLTWENQPGYPVVKVDKIGNKFILTQNRYENNHSDAIYAIPISYTTKSYPDFTTKTPKIWLTTKTLEIEAQDGDDWMVLDSGSTGYFKVEYSPGVSEAFALQLESNDRIFPLNIKSQIFEQIESHKENMEAVKVLKSLTLLRRENDSELWEIGKKIIKFLESRFVGTEVFGKIQAFVKWLIDPHIKRLGFERKKNESSSDEELRTIIIDLSCTFNHAECLNHKMKDVEFQMKNPDIVSFVLCDGLKLANISVHEWFLDSFNNSNWYRASKFLGCSVYPQIIQAHLNSIFDDSKAIEVYVRHRLVISLVMKSPIAMRTGLNFIEKNIKRFVVADDLSDYRKQDFVFTFFFEAVEFINNKEDGKKFINVLKAFNKTIEFDEQVVKNVNETVQKRLEYVAKNVDGFKEI